LENSKTLLLFTGEFPYGKKGEPFLEDEIFYLSKDFQQIYIFPRIKSSVIRPVPGNVIIIDLLVCEPKRLRNQPLGTIIKGFVAVLAEVWNSKQKAWSYFVHLRHFLFIWADAYDLKEKLEAWLMQNKASNTLLYTYWSDTSLLACNILHQKFPKLKIITRVHGFDLYEERNIGEVVPFQAKKYSRVEQIYCISKHGKRYLENRLSIEQRQKLKVAYLGIKAPLSESIPRSSTPLIVSCARMEPFKRIGMIPDVLQLINKPLKWVHIGDGPEFERVKEKIKSLPDYIQVTLMGQTTNSQVHSFYQNNPASLLLSLSTSEGLPVSMMEAISYGIPIVATGINGIPEIVTDKTGILLKPDESIENIAHKITHVILTNPFNRSEIVDFYRKHFNAETNYANFAKEISNLL
jgi:glycosyltransferase involved in cell wall biosynthesis